MISNVVFNYNTQAWENSFLTEWLSHKEWQKVKVTILVGQITDLYSKTNNRTFAKNTNNNEWIEIRCFYDHNLNTIKMKSKIIKCKTTVHNKATMRLMGVKWVLGHHIIIVRSPSISGLKSLIWLLEIDNIW